MQITEPQVGRNSREWRERSDEGEPVNDGTISFEAVVLAGGNGSRFGADIPKQLINLAGQPILYHTLRKFDLIPSVRRVVVAANTKFRPEIEMIARNALRFKTFEIVDGGDSRNQSVANAIATMSGPNDTHVLIHDGVRPLANSELIELVNSALAHADAVVPVIPSADPLFVVDETEVTGFVDRAKVLRGQSPQGFHLGQLRETFPTDGVSAEGYSTVFEEVHARYPALRIVSVPGTLNNIKITTPLDRVIAGQLLLDE